MKLSDFKRKGVPGLYLYDHFEAEDGSFIQMNMRGDHFVHQSVTGERQEFNTLDELTQHLRGLDQ
jgi:hypothetical protein